MKALIAMSGGVDSSVAACLMQEQGYECFGVNMKLFRNEEIGLSEEHTCCSLADAEDARSVAYRLHIPFYVFQFSERFRECVIEPFVRAYENGETPNPCIDCNRYLKFDLLFRRAKELGADYLVTGHYARLERDSSSGRVLLKKAVDRTKDQSYVLYAMTQEQLCHTLFPLGELTKTEVRRIASEHGFVTAQKHDSQDLCFAAGGEYADFIERYTQKKYPPGDILDEKGNVLGQHEGIIRYTLGQRRGLHIAAGEPLYVSAIDCTGNTVTLSPNSSLFTDTLTVRQMNMISVPCLTEPMRLRVKIRYRQPEQWATVMQTGEDELQIRFDTPQRAVTRGQAAVLYDDDVVVGGGTIRETR